MRVSVLYLVAAVACQTPQVASTPATRDNDSATSAGDGPALRGHGVSQCQDWSTLDRTSLAPLPTTAYTATFETVWTTVLEKHFDPTLNCQDWPALRLEYGARLAEVVGPTAAYRLMNEMLGRLDQSHFQVIGPELAAEDAPAGPARCPLQVRIIDGAPIVVDGALDGVNSGIPRGAWLDAIDERPVTTILERVRAKLTRPDDFALEAARAISVALHGTPGQEHAITYRDPASGDALKTQRVSAVMPSGELISIGNLRDLPTRIDARMIEGTRVGYLAFNYWMLPMIQEVESRVASLRADGMEALVLDLRGNPGGVGAMSVPVARLFLQTPGSLGKLQFRDFTQEFNVAGNPDAFTGALAILVDEGTASTSEIFAAGMRDLGRATIVGARASAGAALPSLLERLEDGALLQYVVGDYHSSRGNVAEGAGVTPDVVAAETRADFIAGRDPVLTAAIDTLTRTREPKG